MVKVQCAAKGSPIPSVEWSKDGHLLSMNSTLTGRYRERSSELVILGFTPSDIGTYTCSVKSYENGTAEAQTIFGRTNVCIMHLVVMTNTDKNQIEYSLKSKKDNKM